MVRLCLFSDLQGVMHNDLKSANLLIDRAGSLKVSHPEQSHRPIFVGDVARIVETLGRTALQVTLLLEIAVVQAFLLGLSLCMQTAWNLDLAYPKRQKTRRFLR